MYGNSAGADVDVLCNPCAYSTESGYKTSTKDPRLHRNLTQSVSSQKDLSDKGYTFGRLSPAPMSKRSASVDMSSSPRAEKSSTVMNVTMAEPTAQNGTVSSLEIRKECGTALCFPTPRNTSSSVSQDGQMTGSLNKGIKRVASPSASDIPQGGGLPRNKRMCATDFLDKDIDKDNLP
jgi:hypothetical protein